MQAGIPAVTIIRIVTSEHMQEWINTEVVDVAGAGRVDLESGAVGAHPHHTAAMMGDGCSVLPHCFHIPIIADGDVDPAVNAERDPIGAVVGTAKVETEAESLDQIFRHVGDSVASGVTIRGERWWMHHEQRLAVECQSTRTVHLGEHRIPIRHTVTVVIHQSDNPPFSLVGRERKVWIDTHKERALHRRRQAGRVHRHWRSGEQLCDKTGRRLDLVE